MAKRIFTTQALTWTNQAGGSVITNANSYMALKATVASQLVDILEVLISGMNTSSNVAAMTLAHESTLDTGASALTAPNTDGPEYPAATAIGTAIVVYTTAATTQPTPSNAITDTKLNLALNTFGGIIRWNAAPTQQYQILGSTAPNAACILWNSTTGGATSAAAANAHIIYEPY